ncbi:MAG: hypothetical protein RBR24_05515 [Candidatus Carbobacillus sp.]|nr:hypothetical protein [Candidatus Carbobacillus sp.]
MGSAAERGDPVYEHLIEEAGSNRDICPCIAERFVTAGDVAKTGAGTGAWVGGLFGLLVGAGFFWVPAVGPVMVIGSLASMLLGGVEGAAVGAASGGLLGALVGWGVSHQHILKYESEIKGGKYLVIAHGTQEEVDRAKALLEETDPESVEVHQGAHS